MSFFNLFKRKQIAGMDEIKEFLAKGAVVIDVRTVAEFEQGHAKGSLNIVLDSIPSRVEEIGAMGESFIAVCRSGARSDNAAMFLKAHDFDIINGGPWQNVAQFIE